MEQVHRDRIEDNGTSLSKAICHAILQLVKYLRQGKILSFYMEQDITYHRMPIEQAYRLLEVVQKQGPRAFGVFYQAVCDAELWEAADLLEPSNAPHGSVTTSSSTSVPPSDPVEEDEPLPDGWPSESHFQKVDNLTLEVKTVDDRQMISYFENPAKNETYELNQKWKGRVLIINNEKFTEGLPDRLGSSQDVKGLRRVFQAMNFDECVKNNKTKEEMETILEKECTQDFKDYGCFILIMLSHGAQGKVFGTDGKAPKGGQAKNYIENEEVLKLIGGADSLKGKPKILIIQACQEDAQDDDVESGRLDPDASEAYEPSRASNPLEDTYMVLATAEGYPAYRNTSFGSWFIQAFIFVLANYAYKHDLFGLIRKVRQLVANARTLQDKGQLCVARYETLSKKFFFFPGLPQDPS